MRIGDRTIRRRLRRFTGAAAGSAAASGAPAAVSLVAVSLVAASLVAVPAQAASWTPIQDVTAAGWSGTDSPTVATDRQGDSLLVWTACDDSLPSCYYQVQARLAPGRGGALGPILTLSPRGAVSNWPEVAADDDGDAAVVWEQDGAVVVRRISASGAVGPLLTISGPRAGNPSVAVEPTGRALVSWTEYRNETYLARARYVGADGALGPELALGGSSADRTAVAVDRAGGAIVVWTGDDYRQVTARRLRPGSMAEPLTIAAPAAGVGYGAASVTLDADGDAVISYRQAHPTEPDGFLVRRLGRTDDLGAAIRVTPPGHNVTFYAALATDLDGDSVLAWSRRTEGVLADVHSRTISRTGELGEITSFGAGDRPAVTLDDDGDGLVAWQAAGPSWAFMGVWASTVHRDGRFGAVEQLSTDGRVVRVDSSPTGRLAVTWQRVPYPSYEIQARFGTA